MRLARFQPRPMLVTRATQITRPRFPVIDAHNHIGLNNGWFNRPLRELLDLLDEAHVQVYVDLDGGWGEHVLEQHLDKFKAGAPERFRIFGGVNWSAWPSHGDRFGDWAAGRLRAQVARGAEGLKIWKPFGLRVRDQNGTLVAIDDRRLDPLWETAAELRLPVVFHVADPVAFFEPFDERNERWEELKRYPDWHVPSPPFPPFLTAITQFANLIANHPATVFIGAHAGSYAENLEWVGALLDRCPNFYVDISARISELGRQPYSARRFFLKYADRILFGTDCWPDLDSYRLYYRFLETDDEYFEYNARGLPEQGRWRIYGLYLPDDVLMKVYRDNAARVVLGRTPAMPAGSGDTGVAVRRSS